MMIESPPKTKSVLFAFSFIFCLQLLSQNLPQVSTGKIARIENFNSEFVTPRHIDVWLPSNYSSNTKYSVLYMHDGQALFDSSITWNHQAWDVDDVLSKITPENNLKNVIVVGIWNGGKTRHSDYFPQKPFENLKQSEKDSISQNLKQAGRISEIFTPQSDNYLKFIVTELKPYIDKSFSVNPNRENTFIAGSSMGGLISMYAICEYPNIFGGAACLSTHWIGTFNQNNNPIPAAFLNYLKEKLPAPESHLIYFDCGDQTLDAYYPAIQKQVDQILLQKGYSEKNSMSLYKLGADHSEKSWKSRLHIPLTFLLSN